MPSTRVNPILRREDRQGKKEGFLPYKSHRSSRAWCVHAIECLSNDRVKVKMRKEDVKGQMEREWMKGEERH